MQRLMTRLLFVFLAILCAANSTSVFAEAVLNILPVVLKVNLSPTGVASVSYTVTNDTTQPINQLTIDPDYQSSGNESGISLQNNNCASVTLSPKASCTFQILLNGKGQPSSFFLRPRVCGYDGAVCSVPTENNKVQVVLTTVTYGYVTNYGAGYPDPVNNTVTTCSVQSDGTFYDCTYSNPGNTFNGPAGISINEAGTIAYVANYNGNTVSVCPLNTDRTLSTCTALDPNSTFNGPTSIALNSTSSVAYITNYNSNTVSTCTINSGGILVSCTASIPGNPNTFNGPDGAILNSANTLIYVTNNSNNTVSVCPIESNGILGICTHSDPNSTFNGPAGITLNTAGTFAYVTNSGNDTVSLCSINSSGYLGVCSSLSTMSFAGNGYGKIAINVDDTFAYVPNEDNSYITLCPIKSDGTFDMCSILYGTVINVFVPEGIALH